MAVAEHRLPATCASFYLANVDRNGEVWTGELRTCRYFRFNPKCETWTEYVLPEPYGIDRETWTDNSKTPVTAWYVGHEAFLCASSRGISGAVA